MSSTAVLLFLLMQATPAPQSNGSPGADAAATTPQVSAKSDDLPVSLARIQRALERARERGCDHLLVYGDREHSANIAYLTGFEPRFEEAMLLLAPGKKPALVVGNEGWGYVGISPLDLERVLFQSFSLLSQPRSDSPSPQSLFRARGIVGGSRVGVVGWKYFIDGEVEKPVTTLEVPSYLADALREATGAPDALAFVRRTDFAPSNLAFDAAFAREA